MIPFIAWAIVAGNIIAAAVLIVVSGLTDVVDGFIARHFNMISALGKVLDPIADKLTLGTILVCLCLSNKILLILVGIFFAKELLMAIEGLVVLKKTGTTYSARWYGKVATLCLYASCFLIIVWKNIPIELVYALIALCGFVVVFAFVMYTILNYNKIKQLKTAKTNEEIITN